MNFVLRGLICLVLVASVGSVARATTYLGQIGGQGGTLTQLTCPTGKWATGMQGYTSGYVLHGLRLRCTDIDAEGRWVGDHSWTDLAWTGKNREAITSGSQLCSEDSYIQSVSGRASEKNTSEIPLLLTESFSSRVVVDGISFACYGPNGNRTTIQHVQGGRSFRNATYTSWQNCPDNQGISSVRVRHGWALDSVNFGCTTFRLPVGEIATQEYEVPGPVAFSVAKRNGYEFKPILGRSGPIIPFGCKQVGHHFETPPHTNCAFVGFQGEGKCVRLRDGWKVKKITMFSVYDWRTRPENTARPEMTFDVNNVTGMYRISMINNLTLEGPTGPENNWIQAFTHCSDPAYH